MSKFKIGQIVFVLFDEHKTIVPMRIIAENRQKSVTGTTVTYEAAVGPAEGGKKFSIDDKNKDIVFDSSRRIAAHLLQQAEAAIAAMTSDAEEVAAKWYAGAEPVVDDDDEAQQPQQPQQPQQRQLTETGQQVTRVRLPGGEIVNAVLDLPK